MLGAHISETVVANAIKIKAVAEVLARIVHKPSKSASSIKPMKLAKHKVTPFQAIKLACASESEVQSLTATVSQHRKTVTESFFQCHAEMFDFLPTEFLSVCSVKPGLQYDTGAASITNVVSVTEESLFLPVKLHP